MIKRTKGKVQPIKYGKQHFNLKLLGTSYNIIHDNKKITYGVSKKTKPIFALMLYLIDINYTMKKKKWEHM